MLSSTPIDKSLPNYPRRYYEQIIESVNNAIACGELKVGDTLPSERELADLFNTSRVPVREAIKVLEFCGIVESTAGGMVVKNIEISNLLHKVYFAMSTTDDTLRELFEIRLLLEAYAAERAAKRRNPSDLDEMAASIQDMEEDMNLYRSPYANSHRFHLAVISGSGNEVLMDIYKFLYSLLELSRTRTLADHARLPKSLDFHKQIYACIADGDVHGASESMRGHMLDELARLDTPDQGEHTLSNYLQHQSALQKELP